VLLNYLTGGSGALHNEVKKFKFKKHLIFLIFAMVLIIAPTAEAGSAKIWDTIVKDNDNFPHIPMYQ
jgi:hypothetical protein